MRSMHQVSATALLWAATVAGPAIGQVYPEAGDAGQSLHTAQIVTPGSSTIEGNLVGPLTRDDVDMYQLCLTGGQTFSASTLEQDGGSSSLNTILALFDSEGHAVYFNSQADTGSFDVGAKLPAGTSLTPAASGNYFLAIASDFQTPRDTAGAQMFDQPRVGVGGSISSLPLGSWSSLAPNEGTYRIILTGTCPAAPTFTVSDFLPPINVASVNAAQAGRTIPVKWLLTDANGNPVDDPTSFVSITSDPGGGICTGLPSETTESTAGASGLQYLGNGLWQFNWKTSSSYAGQCRLMTLTLSDGTEASAIFEFN